MKEYLRLCYRTAALIPPPPPPTLSINVPQRGTEAKFSEGAWFSRANYHVFLQTRYFCGNIINYLYHYVYSNLFDIAKFLTQNDYDPMFW